MKLNNQLEKLNKQMDFVDLTLRKLVTKAQKQKRKTKAGK